MESQKKTCYNCRDKIKGQTKKVRFLNGSEKKITIDTGCFLYLKEKGLI